MGVLESPGKVLDFFFVSKRVGTLPYALCSCLIIIVIIMPTFSNVP